MRPQLCGGVDAVMVACGSESRAERELKRVFNSTTS